MNPTTAVHKLLNLTKASLRYPAAARSYFAGGLISLGFAPFHYPGFAILGIALLFAQLQTAERLKQAFSNGFCFGLGTFSVGISWVFVSIHSYGHLDSLLSMLITALFVCYLALYPGLMALLFKRLTCIPEKLQLQHQIYCCLVFSALWCLSEYARATVMGGFPWLLLGTGQIDTPLRYLLPIIGIYGVSFLSCLAASCLSCGILNIGLSSNKRLASSWIIAFVIILLAPNLLKHKHWTQLDSNRVTVGVLQANLSMRDKWDEALFWRLLKGYQDGINSLLGRKKLIVLPESAIPIPAHYISDVLEDLDTKAKLAGSAILLGIPRSAGVDADHDYNTMTTLGRATGSYLKQHLVPFGEFIPQPFQKIIDALSIPVANLTPGSQKQTLIQVDGHPIASLICYELAYPLLLRQQLPEAEWIVSISDDGWFGHSLAMYQQLQMAQVLSMLTGRFQVVANNDGLSAVINTQGDISDVLPAQRAGVLEASMHAARGATPWVIWGDAPALILCMLFLLLPLRLLWFNYRKI